VVANTRWRIPSGETSAARGGWWKEGSQEQPATKIAAAVDPKSKSRIELLKSLNREHISRLRLPLSSVPGFGNRRAVRPTSVHKLPALSVLSANLPEFI
jgi:hypothetical protein